MFHDGSTWENCFVSYQVLILKKQYDKPDTLRQ